MAARRPISVLTLFGGLASTIFWPICHYANQAVGWRGAWLLCAVSVLVICTTAAVMSRAADASISVVEWANAFIGARSSRFAKPTRTLDERRVVFRKAQTNHARVGAIGIERRERDRRRSLSARQPD